MRGLGLAAGVPVGEYEFEELGPEIVLAGPGEPFGQGVEHLAELEVAQPNVIKTVGVTYRVVPSLATTATRGSATRSTTQIPPKVTGANLG